MTCGQIECGRRPTEHQGTARMIGPGMCARPIGSPQTAQTEWTPCILCNNMAVNLATESQCELLCGGYILGEAGPRSEWYGFCDTVRVGL